MTQEVDVLALPILSVSIRAADFELLAQAVDTTPRQSGGSITKRNENAEVTITSEPVDDYCANCEVPAPHNTIRYNPPNRDESVETLCDNCYRDVANAVYDQYERDDKPLAITPADAYTAVWFDAIPHAVRKNYTPMLQRRLEEAQAADYAIGGGLKQSGPPVQVTTTKTDTPCEVCDATTQDEFVRLHYDDPHRLVTTTFYCPPCADALRKTVTSYVNDNADDLLSDAL